MEEQYGEYTQMLDNAIWTEIGTGGSDDCSYEEVIAQINNRTFFRSFSERLLSFYNEITGDSCSAESASKAIQKMASERGIQLNRNTMNSWFAGKNEPKMGDSYRTTLFKIAFALNLDCGGTERLFHRVYLDRAFNQRNYRECIYLFCIYYGLEYQSAESLIERVERNIQGSPAGGDPIVETCVINNYIKDAVSEKEILDYILSHRNNFKLRDITAKSFCSGLIREITGDHSGIGLAKREFDFFAAGHLSEEIKGRDTHSLDFALYIIFDCEMQAGGCFGKNAAHCLPKEILNQFPDKKTFGMAEPSSYILRKELILLYFYVFWVKDRLQGKSQGLYDVFVDELNDLLFQSGYSLLYPGNPYDWLFLYCAAEGSMSDSTSPLDVFREMIAEIKTKE